MSQTITSIVLVMVSCSLVFPVLKATPQPAKPYDHDLSNIQHNPHDPEKHDLRYDHDAFLGKDVADEYTKLSPEESKERLRSILTKIDKDKDGDVSKKEMYDWVKYISHKSIVDDAESQWKSYEVKGDKFEWDAYVGWAHNIPDHLEEKDKEERREDLLMDQKKWKQADRDYDNALSREEWLHFLHPEEAEHMHDIVVGQHMAHMDLNKDGYIDRDEYLKDQSVDMEERGVNLTQEAISFTTYLDKNKDGRMDSAELKQWVLPTNFDHVDAEVNHLFHHADGNEDNQLTYDEIMEKADLFVGSRATDYGEALKKHTEL